MSRVGNNIKSARIEKGLSQEALAEKVGVEGATVSRWESGTYNPKPQYVPLLAAVLDKPAKLFADGEPPAWVEDMDPTVKEEMTQFVLGILKAKGVGVDEAIAALEAAEDPQSKPQFRSADGKVYSEHQVVEQLRKIPDGEREHLLEALFSSPDNYTEASLSSKKTSL